MLMELMICICLKLVSSLRSLKVHIISVGTELSQSNNCT